MRKLDMLYISGAKVIMDKRFKCARQDKIIKLK